MTEAATKARKDRKSRQSVRFDGEVLGKLTALDAAMTRALRTLCGWPARTT